MSSEKLSRQKLENLLNASATTADIIDSGLGPSFLHLLATAGRQLLSKLLSEHHYQPGEIIFKEGDSGDTMYIKHYID